MTLQELIAELNKLNPSPKEFADALKQSAAGHFQEMFNRGHSTATEENKGKIKSLEGDVERERERAAKAEAKVQKLESEKPDVAKVKQEYEGEITTLKEQLEAARKEGAARVQRVLDGRSVADLTALLVTEYGIDKDMAEVQAQKHASRIRHAPIEGQEGEFKLEVVVDGKNIPIQAEKPLTELAREIDGKVDAKFKNANVDTGGRTRGGGGANGGDPFTKIREDVKKQQESAGKRESAAERMGLAGAK